MDYGPQLGLGQEVQKAAIPRDRWQSVGIQKGVTQRSLVEADTRYQRVSGAEPACQVGTQ